MGFLSSPFFKQKLKIEKNRLAQRIRKHLIEPEYRKSVLDKDHQGELKDLYFIGLMRAANHNRLGKFIRKNSKHWASTLNLDESLVKLYINYCSDPVSSSLLLESRSSPYLPITSLEPWLSFLTKYEEIEKQPMLVEQTFEKSSKRAKSFYPPSAGCAPIL